MNGMIMDVLRHANGMNATNGGITSKVTRVIVTGKWADGTPIPEIFEPREDCPEVKVGVNLPPYFHVYPIDLNPKLVGPMFGGNFVYSSDSRCPAYPIPVHDRQETPQQYNLLSG